MCGVVGVFTSQVVYGASGEVGVEIGVLLDRTD